MARKKAPYTSPVMATAPLGSPPVLLGCTNGADGCALGTLVCWDGSCVSCPNTPVDQCPPQP